MIDGPNPPLIFQRGLCREHGGFTFIELLSAITIVALLAIALIVFIPAFMNWARQTSDKQTLTILNDTLTRYKTEGGSLSALTAGAPVGDVLMRLAGTISWGGMVHQVMEHATTYPARSLSAMGNGTSYQFYRYNTYSQTTPPVTPPTYTYGLGVGYMSNNGDSNGYDILFDSDSGYGAFKDSSGNITYVQAGNETVLSPAASYTFWSCLGNGDPTPFGDLFFFAADNGYGNAYCQYGTANLTALDVTGLTSLQDLECSGNQFASLAVSNLTSLSILWCDGTPLSSLDVTALTGLNYLSVENCALSSLNLTGLNQLTILWADGNQLSSLNVNGLTRLNLFGCGGNLLASLNLSSLNNLTEVLCQGNQIASLTLPTNVSKLQSLSCSSNPLTSLNLSSYTALTGVYCSNDQLTSLSLPASSGGLYVDMYGNSALTGSTGALNSFYGTLPTVTGSNYLWIGNGAPSATDSIASGKGWTVQRRN